MNISLTSALEGFVKDQVAGGMYHSASEVVRAGLRLLQEQTEDRRARRERLRQGIAAAVEALDRGEGSDGEQVFHDLLGMGDLPAEKSE
jgi:antitoxin ParD1/3/4